MKKFIILIAVCLIALCLIILGCKNPSATIKIIPNHSNTYQFFKHSSDYYMAFDIHTGKAWLLSKHSTDSFDFQWVQLTDSIKNY